MRTLLAFVVVGVLCASAGAATPAEEIDQLVAAIETSGCTFVRNGKRYEAAAAADHLRLKLRRASRHAKTPEMFIDRLASKSSMSGKPYLLECPDKAAQESGPWLRQRLEQLRANPEESTPNNRT